ncbi:extracellular solute-binding protein [Mesobacillus stamsii]|uniref:ABC-type glycerol-3-phosphate transport system substrate-binding protein n=1 Tax=Mesobacillus stamsii TaxID=225347 RepID=A0ABU0G0Q3_9BACI|nr:extracellular solute-binding protein [Mesobacillus stamsii]MDQ0415777.1 ABC-type glycerol-3-phosphate transport system substrate-binding protein [Mesobacillus stamsii]
MKKLLSIVILLFFTIVLAACNNTESSTLSQSNSSNSSNTSNWNQKEESATSDNEWDKMELGENGPVEIDFWHIQATIYGEAVNEIVDKFNKKYEGKIKVNNVFQGEYDALNKKIRASIQGGGLPNVSMAYEGDALEYMKANKIVSLDSFLKSEKYGYSQAELDDIVPGVLARQSIPQYDGKTMSWIHGNSAMGIYYNKEILKQAGFDKPATTWKEFEQQAIEIFEKTGVPALTLPENLGANFGIWLRTYGIEPVNLSDHTVNYDNEQALELITIIKNLVDTGAAVIAQDTEQEFTNERAAMEIGTTARSTTKIDLIENKFDWAIDLIPQGDESNKSTALWGGNHVMFKSTPEEELASWVFMKYFASPEAQSIYAAKTGYFPAVKSAQDTDLLSQDYSANPQKRQAFENVVPYARITAPTAAIRAVNDAVATAVSLHLNNNANGEDALKKMNMDAQESLNKYK